MTVAIIGASGFIGSHTIVEAEAQDIPAIGFDRTTSRYAAQVLDVTWPWRTIARILQTEEISAVINYAGLLGTSELFDNVRSAIRVNIEGQYNVARAALELDIPLVTIEQPHIWTNPYETTRGAGVRLARSLAHHKGLRLATVTTYNAFGERQGYGGDHPQKFVPTFSVYGWNDEPFPIYGDGSQWVNAIYARDIAKVFLTAIQAASPKAPSFMGAAIRGNYTVNDIANIVWTMTEATKTFDYLDMRDGETDDGVGASADEALIMANGDFGVHVPVFDDRDLARTVQWYRQFKVDSVFP